MCESSKDDRDIFQLAKAYEVLLQKVIVHLFNVIPKGWAGVYKLVQAT